MPTAITPVLLDLPLRTPSGTTTTLRTVRGPGATVVVFLRHFGCLFCRERALQVRQREAELQAAGATLVFVGTGLPAMAADFARTHLGAHVVLCDPTRAVFAAAGMRRSLGSTLHWRLFANAWRALRAGWRQTAVQGDPWQQGGVLVLDAGGAVVHRQVDAVGGDPLDLAAVLHAVTARS
jgi:peroxiredoxin